jgi:hypothetical protein
MQSQTEHCLLVGGTANRGRVVRAGDSVRRPYARHSPAVHALLRHLSDSGFDASPRVLGVDGRTEVLGYIEGTAATEPLADWALTDEALSSVAALLRECHRHASTFDGAGLSWQRPVPRRWRGTLVTHNDLNPANVIFRDGRAVAFIDFDLAAPATPAWELAVAACFWAPLRDSADITDLRREHVFRRFRLLLDSYGADAQQRRDAALATGAANRWIAGVIEDAARHGHPAFGRLWQQAMGMHRRASVWLATNTTQLLAAGR